MPELIDAISLGRADILPLRTLTVPPYTSTNTIIYGHKRFVVIDPGTTDEEQSRWLKERIQWRLALGHRFELIALTHHHGDHVNGSRALRDHFSVPILAHPAASSHVDFAIDIPVAGPHTLDLGDSSLQVLPTPGHTESHLVFYDEEAQALVMGDMLTALGTTLIPSHLGSLKHYLDSLERLCLLPLKVLIPGHGQPIDHKPTAFLQKALKHRYERLLAILELLIREGALLDATDITIKVYQKHIAENLMFFAQLSVEASLHWLHEMDLIANIDYKWQALSALDDKKQLLILDRLEEIRQRMANT